MSISESRSSGRADATSDATLTPDQAEALRVIWRSTTDMRNLALQNDLQFLSYLLDMAVHEAERLARAMPHDVIGRRRS